MLNFMSCHRRMFGVVIDWVYNAMLFRAYVWIERCESKLLYFHSFDQILFSIIFTLCNLIFITLLIPHLIPMSLILVTFKSSKQFLINWIPLASLLQCAWKSSHRINFKTWSLDFKFFWLKCKFGLYNLEKVKS